VISGIYGEKRDSFGVMIAESFGKGAGKAVIFIFWLKLIIVSGIWLKEFSVVIHSTMLDSMPFEFIAAAIAVACFFLAQKDIEVRGRTAEIFIAIMTLLFIPVLIMVAAGADYSNLLSVKGFDAGAAARSVFIVFASLGSADYLWFLYPKTNMGRKRSEMIKAVIITGIMLIVTLAVVFSVFGKSIGDRVWPVLRMMDTVDFPGAFIERQDVLMIGFWMMSFYIYISGGITYGTYLFKEITGRESYMVTGILIFAISVLDFPVEMSVAGIMMVTTPLFLVVLPILIALARRVRKA